MSTNCLRAFGIGNEVCGGEVNRDKDGVEGESRRREIEKEVEMWGVVWELADDGEGGGAILREGKGG